MKFSIETNKQKSEKAKNGDQVIIDFKGTINKIEFNGGSAIDYPLVLGSNSFIPGFEKQLIGCKAGDDKNVKVTFPDDYGSKDLAGKNAEFACKVKNVKEPVPAKINDELATKIKNLLKDEIEGHNLTAKELKNNSIVSFQDNG